MLVSDILRTCTYGHVAEAAVASIGGDFARSVRSRAEEHGQTVGDFTASHVKRFSRQASERDMRSVMATMHGQDLALLAGLEAVMTRMMADGRADMALTIAANARVQAVAA